MAILPIPIEPLDVFLFFNNLIEKWNDELKCDLCWEFTAPIRASDLNEYQFRTTESGCCVLVAITDYEFDTVRNYDRSSTLRREKYVTHSFNLNILVQDSIGRNVYNEIKNHNLQESKWATILKPLYDCLSVDEVLDFCEELGYNVSVDRWRGFTRIDWMDSNFTGWTIAVSLREKIE